MARRRPKSRSTGSRRAERTTEPETRPAPAQVEQSPPPAKKAAAAPATASAPAKKAAPKP